METTRSKMSRIVHKHCTQVDKVFSSIEIGIDSSERTIYVCRNFMAFQLHKDMADDRIKVSCWGRRLPTKEKAGMIPVVPD